MFNLTSIQHDALVEIFNIGVGRAAKALSSIVHEDVSMNVPTISFLGRENALHLLGGDEGRRICGVSQHYCGAFDTEAILMFPENKSLEIVRLMVGEAVPMDELTEMEQEALSEVGNIILNACVGTLANIFGKELHGSLPVYHLGSSQEILGLSNQGVLMLHIDFLLVKTQITGNVAFLMGLDAFQDLQNHVDLYLQGFMASS